MGSFASPRMTKAEESHRNIGKFDELMKYTDLVLLDIKHIDDEEHKK